MYSVDYFENSKSKNNYEMTIQIENSKKLFKNLGLRNSTTPTLNGENFAKELKELTISTSALSVALHTSEIIDNRLLIFSGYTGTFAFEFFYLDLSKSFDNDNLTWTLIPEGSLPVNTYDATAVLSSDNIIYLIGGYMTNKITLDFDYSNLVYTYDYPTSTWSTPKLGGVNSPRQGMKGIIDNSGTIYIFGGYNSTYLKNNTRMVNDMNILKTVSNTWATLQISENLPIECAEYTANILPNGIIVYIGGIEKSSAYTYTLVNINQIKLFDTSKLEWSYINATGNKIDSRIYFTSVLTSDGYIIIFGDCTYQTYVDPESVSPKLAMLDTNKNPFEWSIPSNSEVNSPPSIYGHTANLYNDYMIITFGFNLDTQLYSYQVYLYNIESNKWVTTFSPTTITSSPTRIASPHTAIVSAPEKKKSKALAIGLGTTLGGVTFLISLIFITRFIVSRKRRSSSVIEIPGSNKLKRENTIRHIKIGFNGMNSITVMIIMAYNKIIIVDNNNSEIFSKIEVNKESTLGSLKEIEIQKDVHKDSLSNISSQQLQQQQQQH
ncbi:hypothetical protein Glove_33g260 [Diversispora epigaea]|uniref:BTB domain-containing protein n=1 Tax=Diversispora epigaea TaxID=1348612 RepID=A0A397JI26_9GLOM|nr:hypothetical protein Glove_33g260 [Diversispora epigaea]